MKAFAQLVSFSMILLGTAPALAQQDAAVVAFTGARLIDGTGAAPVDAAVLLVRNGRVEAVGTAADVAIPSDAQRVDLSGRFVLPGLINSHGHAAQDTAAALQTFASYGVTSVVSLGGEDERHVALRDAQDPAAPRGARLFVAGPVQEHQAEEAAERAVAQLAALKVDYVKARVDRGSMPEAAYTALIRAAHAQGLRVAAHMYTLADTKGLVRAGVDVLAHSVRDQPVDAELLQLFAGSATCLVPTLTRDLSTFVYAATPDFFSDPFFLRAVQPETLDQLTTPEAQRRAAAGAQANRAAFALAQRNLKTLHEAGVRIALGTDSGLPGRFAGYFEHLELQLMAAAGMAPMDVIVAATGNAAACMGLDDVGTLTPGKWADFIVLADDPLADLAHTKSLAAVYIAGVALQP